MAMTTIRDSLDTYFKTFREKSKRIVKYWVTDWVGHLDGAATVYAGANSGLVGLYRGGCNKLACLEWAMSGKGIWDEY